MYFSKGVNLSFCSKKGMFSLFVFGQKRTRNKVYDVLDRKETFYDYKNNNFLTTQKWHFFKGVNPCFWSNNAIWFSLFSVKKGLEIRFNDVLDRKQTFLTIRRKFFSPKNGIFPKGLTLLLVKKCNFFSWFVFGQKRLETRLNDVLDRKETCFDYKNKIFKRLKNHIFSKGLTHAFRQKMEFFSGFVFGQKRTRNKV